MTLENEALALAVSASSRTSDADRLALLQRVETQYRQRSCHSQGRRALGDAVANADLGAAAYAIGCHYLVHGDARAERWLRLAADRHIGDAALRLARICETREVRSFNAALDLVTKGCVLPAPEVGFEASSWYAAAAADGYDTLFGIGGPGEEPSLSLSCCQAVALDLAQAATNEMIEAARAEAWDIVARASADARSMRADARAGADQIVELARAEFSGLAARSRALEMVIRRQAAAVSERQLAPSPPMAARSARRSWLGRAMVRVIAASARVIRGTARVGRAVVRLVRV
jgi:hypothetical protein